MINVALKLLCQILISLILIKTIYCLLVPKIIRKNLSRIGYSVSGVICDGLSGINNSIPKSQDKEPSTPNLRRVK